MTRLLRMVGDREKRCILRSTSLTAYVATYHSPLCSSAPSFFARSSSTHKYYWFTRRLFVLHSPENTFFVEPYTVVACTVSGSINKYQIIQSPLLQPCCLLFLSVINSRASKQPVSSHHDHSGSFSSPTVFPLRYTLHRALSTTIGLFELLNTKINSKC